MAPAMHIAVRQRFGMQQAARFLQRFDDDGVGFPDHHAAEQRQAFSVVAIAHDGVDDVVIVHAVRSEEPTSELQSLMRISYAVFCLKKKKNINNSSIYII